MTITWFDAHLDLAYLAVSGRDLTPGTGPAATPLPPRRSRSRRSSTRACGFALATIFTEPVEATTVGGDSRAAALEAKFAEPQMYRAGDAAPARGRACSS